MADTVYSTLIRASLFLLGVCSTLSCGMVPWGPGKGIVRADGMVVPTRWSHRFASWEGEATRSLLRHDQLYVFHLDESRLYRIQRFWPNGRMCEWRAASFANFDPDAFDQRTDAGRFVLKGNQIEIETVGVDETGARYVHWSGRIESSGEIVYEWKDRYMGDVSLKFSPVNFGPMNRSADW